MRDRLQLAVDAVVLRVWESGLKAVAVPGGKARLERIGAGSLLVRVELPLLSAVARLRLFTSAEGRLGVELAEIDAGLLPVPVSLAAAAIREFLPAQPWVVQRPGTRWDLDFASLVQPYGIELPPLAEVRAVDGLLELSFAGERAPTPAPAAHAPATEADDAPRTAAAEPSPAAPAIRFPRGAWSDGDLEAQFPAVLAGDLPPAGYGTVYMRFTLRNPTTGLLSVRLQARPAWVGAQPESAQLRPGAEQGVVVSFALRQVTPEVAGVLSLLVRWSVLETDPGGGNPSTRNGELTIPILSPGRG